MLLEAYDTRRTSRTLARTATVLGVCAAIAAGCKTGDEPMGNRDLPGGPDAGPGADARPPADATPTGDAATDAEPNQDASPDAPTDPRMGELDCDPTVSVSDSGDRRAPRPGWRWYYGQSVQQVQDRIDAGYRIVDLEVEDVDPLEFTVAMIENTGDRQKAWWWYYHQTREQLDQKLETNNARLIDLEVLSVGGQRLYSAVMIENSGDDHIGDWRYIADGTPENILDTGLENNLRAIDFDPWQKADGSTTYSAVLVDNTGNRNRAWWMYYGQSESELNDRLNENNAYIRDIDRANDGDFTVVMDQPQNSPRPRWWWYGYDAERLRELFRRLGSRIVDVQRLDNTADPEFLVIMEGWTHPRTGVAVDSFTAFDREIQQLMWKWESPGASLAVMRHGKLMYARSYGYDRTSLDDAVRPSDRFRIASLSKPITKSAIFRLRDQGQLDLNDTVFTEHLSRLVPSNVADSRINNITIRHLLNHTGGWDIKNNAAGTVTRDPMFNDDNIRQDLNLSSPPSCAQRITWVLDNRDLDYTPGQTPAYSNFGYCILGRVIEAVTGVSYQSYVQQNVLQPTGATRMRLGNTRRSDQATSQVRYYDRLLDPEVDSVFPSDSTDVPQPYGGFYLEAMDAHGGWIATAADYVRYAARTEWSPFPNNNGNWRFQGSLSGTQTAVQSTRSGDVVMALFLNTRLAPVQGRTDLLDAMNRALGQVESWPCHDLDEQIP